MLLVKGPQAKTPEPEVLNLQAVLSSFTLMFEPQNGLTSTLRNSEHLASRTRNLT